jgi:hypothetical protein
MAEGQQLRLEPCRYCATCPANRHCDEGATGFGCDNTFVPPEQGGRDVLHPARPDLADRLWESGTFDIRVWTNQPQKPLPPLPAYIPRVQPHPAFQCSQIRTLAVPIDQITKAGRVLSADETRERLGALPETALVVTCFHLDSFLESLWDRRRALTASIASAGYDLVTVPNFSVWEGDTRLEHRYNIARSLRVFELFVDAGIPTAPSVSWFLTRDLDDWITFLRGWSGIRAFSVDLATLKAEEEDWEWGIRGLRRLFDGIGRDWEVLVNGVAKSERITEVSKVCGHIHLINEHSFHVAMSGQMTAEEFLSSEMRRTPKAQMDIFLEEIKKTEEALQVLPESCRLRVAA